MRRTRTVAIASLCACLGFAIGVSAPQQGSVLPEHGFTQIDKAPAADDLAKFLQIDWRRYSYLGNGDVRLAVKFQTFEKGKADAQQDLFEVELGRRSLLLLSSPEEPVVMVRVSDCGFSDEFVKTPPGAGEKPYFVPRPPALSNAKRTLVVTHAGVSELKSAEPVLLYAEFLESDADAQKPPRRYETVEEARSAAERAEAALIISADIVELKPGRYARPRSPVP